jgi:hypothetical protein
MKMLLLVAGIVALVAVAAWVLSSSKPADASYTVEMSDVAVVPGSPVMPEVVVRANQMPEVVVRGAPDQATTHGSEDRIAVS